jgi:hypothetical protein
MLRLDTGVRTENGPESFLTRGRRPVPQQDGVARYQNRRGGVASKTDAPFSLDGRSRTT